MMNNFYKAKNFILGNPSYSGHETYPDAVYVNSEQNNQRTKVIFKKNKHGHSGYSRLEVAFTKLAALFLAENTTSDQDLVYEESFEIVGIGAQHLCYVINNKEGLTGCDFHLMSKLPECPAQYKNSYIFIKTNDTQELYYIKHDGEYEKAKIADFKLFEEKINAIKNKDETKLHLSQEQIKEIITSNGGHTRLTSPCYILCNPEENCSMQSKIISKAEDIPVYFLDKLPHGYFAKLMQAEKEKKLSINYASLASIFTGSYTLEEDDLHKGNFGFYIIEKEKKPHVVFFKIDHDLMFVDSIMSFYTARFYHWGHNVSAFNISTRDLLNFPVLYQSSNSYWPAKSSFFANPFAKKDYSNRMEIEAFSNLKNEPEFKKAKWMFFLKHILIPQELIELTLHKCLNEKNAYDRAQIALIVHATITRQAHLRAVLFSIKEFREFVANLSDDSKNFLKYETCNNKPQFEKLVNNTLDHYQELCLSKDFIDEEDTPLHVSIKLGDYRYDETLQMFGEYLNKENKSGETPLDTALYLHNLGVATHKDVRTDHLFILKHLLENNAQETPDFNNANVKSAVTSYQFNTDYLYRSENAKDYLTLKNTLRDIGEDHQFCLKFKKVLSIQCIQKFIESNQGNPRLEEYLIQLKKDVNGSSSETESSPLLFIRQLRSKLWIVRQIRGLYGWTSTQSEINDIIDHKLEQLESVDVNQFSFFSSSIFGVTGHSTILDKKDCISLGRLE